MDIIILSVIITIVFCAIIIWFFVEKDLRTKPCYYLPHNVFRGLIPLSILSIWLVLSIINLDKGEIIDHNKVFTIGDEIPIQVIVVDEPKDFPTFPKSSKYTSASIINLNRHFGCIIPEGTIVDRQHSCSSESLGVSYVSVRSDDLILVLPDNIRTVNNLSNPDP